MNGLNALVSRKKKFQATFFLLFSYLFLLILPACIENLDSNPFGECSSIGLKANLIDFEVFFEPYKNDRYATADDEVNFDDFKLNLKLTLDQISQSSSSNFPGRAYALSCLAIYDVRNVSNIAIILAAPYEGMSIGTDISYLFITQNEIRLSEFRDFSKLSNFISLSLLSPPSSKTQLKTKTIVFFRNGNQQVIETTSPTLLIN